MGSMFPYYSSQRLFLDDIIIIMDVESNLDVIVNK